MKIIFMGSPEFAVPALDILISSQHEIVAVYTQEPRPAGRGYEEKATAVHRLAEQNNLIIKTPKNFRSQEEVARFAEFQADLAVVVAYGIILPQIILQSTKYGAINIHPSKLPKYRGAAPLQHTILGGDQETAVCIIKMDEGVDTGQILLQQDISLSESINFKELHDMTAKIGAQLMLKTINNFHNITPQNQSLKQASYAKKITKEEAYIDWQKDSIEIIDRKIRALNPYPGTFFLYQQKIIKIKSAKIIKSQHNYLPGTIIDELFSIACIGGILVPIVLQRQDKREMQVKEFIQGYKFKIGDIISPE